MAEVLVFHHAQGLTPGMHAFAADLRAAGHVVHLPDLFEGRTFASIEEGVAHIEAVGFEEMRERGVRLADALPENLVYAGFSFGVLPAQKLAQTRPGARGAVGAGRAVGGGRPARGRSPTRRCRSARTA